MKQKRQPKSLKWKYRTNQVFIFGIIGLLTICFVMAFVANKLGAEFCSSALLNIFGGLFTGLIILTYQYFSSQNLNHAGAVIEKLELLEILPRCGADLLDFCTDQTRPFDEELKDQGVEEDVILGDEESATYALGRFSSKIDSIEHKLRLVKEFLDTKLNLPCDPTPLEEQLEHLKKYFAGYEIRDEWQRSPYFLYQIFSNADSDVPSYESMLGAFVTEDELSDYLSKHPDLGRYRVEYPGEELQPVKLVFVGDSVVHVKDVYKIWIEKMNALNKHIKSFNDRFAAAKQRELEEYEKNSHIVH